MITCARARRSSTSRSSKTDEAIGVVSWPRLDHRASGRGNGATMPADGVPTGSLLYDRWTHVPLRPVFLSRPVHSRHAEPRLTHQHRHLPAVVNLVVDQDLQCEPARPTLPEHVVHYVEVAIGPARD